MDWKQTLRRTVDGAQKAARTAADSSRSAWQLQELQSRLRTQKLALADWALTRYDDGAIDDEAVRTLCAGIREDEARAEQLRATLQNAGRQVSGALRRGYTAIKNTGCQPHRLCCPGCGAPLGEQFAFCPHCGCRLETVDDLVGAAAEVPPPPDAGEDFAGADAPAGRDGFVSADGLAGKDAVFAAEDFAGAEDFAAGEDAAAPEAFAAKNDFLQ